MTITAKIVADSVSDAGIRLSTLEIKYPYIILGQLLMHRAFSRNSQSNRAIPVKRLIQRVQDDPYTPVFRANKPGMVAGAEIADQAKFLVSWNQAREAAIAAASDMLDVHKETVNRLLLPFMHVTTLITATEWDNFFTLRIEDNAQPEIQQLAESIKNARDSSTPELLMPGQWHLPYVAESDHPDAIKLSVARCARVSYLTHDNEYPSAKDDLRLYTDLITSKPVHGSPAEHQATPFGIESLGLTHVDMKHQRWSNNFRGWGQYRAIIGG